MSNEIKDAYFAGLIDGEGHISIHSRGANRTKGRPIIVVAMTCERTINAIRDHFGVGTVRPAKVKEGCKPQWRWRVSYKNARIVADRIRPYLITKEEALQKVFPK